MNFKKTVAIAAAAGALAAVSVPAFALENEFHGMYRLRAMMSNYENAGGGALHAGTTADPTPTLTVFEQRARLQYIAKTSADLKLVTHFEIDSSWGDTAYSTGRGAGGAQAADTVNLETKNVYLDFNESLTGANVKVGIQGVSDAYKGILVTDDMAGILATKKFGALTGTAGFFRLQDFNGRPSTNPAPTGRKNLDLYLLDAKFAVSKDLTVGGSYYLVSRDDQFNAQNMHMIGANVAAKFNNITADGFLAYQTGDAIMATTKQDLSAFAAQAAIKADLGAAGTVRGNVLYTSGDNHAANSRKNDSWQCINSGDALTTSSASYYDSKMMLLMRNVVNMDTDKALIMYTNNNNRGLTLLTVGYDFKFNDKLAASANLGYGAASEKHGANSASIGTEVNAQVDYKLFSNLTASFQWAYVFLGDGMNKNNAVLLSGGKADADDPYLTALMLNYSF
ncbi:MAG: hypothetical protein PHF56_08395 [Desulfuromonadaceae bacterium]|nr:hypothetical protein [Desulfuromonadaceae bacterium]